MDKGVFAALVSTLGLLAGTSCGIGDPSAVPPSSGSSGASQAPGLSERVPDATVPPASRPPVTVGSTSEYLLPDGWTLVSPAPDRYTSDFDALLHDFGQDVAVAFGARGEPVVAWASLTDSANNGYTISASSFVPPTGWSTPVEVARARLAPGPSGRLFSMSGNVAAGTLAVAFERHDDAGSSTGIDVAVSVDSGMSWIRTPAADGEAFRPAVAVGSRSIFVAYVAAEGYAVASAAVPKPVSPDQSTRIDEPAPQWTTRLLPMLEGYVPTDNQPAIAVDQDDKAAVASIAAPPSGDRRAAVYVNLDERAAVSAIEVGGVSPGSGSVGLAFRESGPLVSLAFEPRSEDDVLAYVASSDDMGETFGTPSRVPNTLHERAPFGIGLTVLDTIPTNPRTASTAPAATGEGRAVLSFEPDSVDAAASNCGLPRLVSSSNLTDWTTCGAGEGSTSPAISVMPGNLSPSAIGGPDGRIYVPVANRNPSAPLPLGIVIWSGP